MNDPRRILSENLIYLKEISGLSATTFAKKIRISPKTYKKLETGSPANKITLTVFENIYEIFGIPASVMISDNKSMISACYNKNKSPSV